MRRCSGRARKQRHQIVQRWREAGAEIDGLAISQFWRELRAAEVGDDDALASIPSPHPFFPNIHGLHAIGGDHQDHSGRPIERGVEVLFPQSTRVEVFDVEPDRHATSHQMKGKGLGEVVVPARIADDERSVRHQEPDGTMTRRSVKVFLSYASEQKDVARSIEVALRGEGHAVFLDRSALEPGETYNDQIREAIAASDLFVFLITPEALAPGRYTLTELELAERRWPSPSGHVLPVVVRPTPIATIPPYLKGVTLLEPRGNVAAEVAAAVARLGRLLRQAAIPLVGAVVLAIAYASWSGYQHWLTGREASTLLETGRLQHQSGDYSAAWSTMERARAMAPTRHDVLATQEQLAMDWLDRIRVTTGQGTFTAIVLKVQPVLARCAVSRDRRRAADCLAHEGWGDFLRTREGAGGLDPVQYYRRAIDADPENVYGHAMWGFDLLRSRGSPAQAMEHFAKALGSGREREYVRHLEIAGWLWRGDDSADEQVIRIADQIRLNRETMPAGTRRAPTPGACGTSTTADCSVVIKCRSSSRRCLLPTSSPRFAGCSRRARCRRKSEMPISSCGRRWRSTQGRGPRRSRPIGRSAARWIAWVGL